MEINNLQYIIIIFNVRITLHFNIIKSSKYLLSSYFHDIALYCGSFNLSCRFNAKRSKKNNAYLNTFF